MVKAVKTEAFMPADAAEMADQFRNYAEQALDQSRDAYAKMKVSMEDAQKAIEATVEKVQSANADLGLKAIAAIRKSTDASLTHMEKLMGVKSFSAFVELQTSFLREQTELAVSQSKLLQEAAQKTVTEVTAPAKAAYEKVAKELKVA
ncbi:MAG: phasin family protein [Rhizobiaceae bacterium]|nr:phasin family protein [Rhizobiaceae bacterium]